MAVTEAVTPQSLDDPFWTPILDGLCGDAMDCLQTTLATLSDRAHGRGAHLALGAHCGYGLDATDPVGRGGAVSERYSLEGRLAQAERLLGLRPIERRSGLDGPALRALAEDSGSVYVVADAYLLPWVAYAGHEHMPHSFLLLPGSAGDAMVIDAYHNDTQWGPCRPGIWTVQPEVLDAAAAAGAIAVTLTADRLPPLNATAALVRNAGELPTASRRAAYLAALRADLHAGPGIERLVLDIWLVSRERALHAAWLATTEYAEAGAELARRTERWGRLSAQSYIALRRARRGQPTDPAIVDDFGTLIADETALLGECASAAVRRAVVTAISAVLGVPEEEVLSAQTLRDVPGFNSFRLVEVIDRVERDVCVELGPDDIAATGLRDVASLSELFTMAATGDRS